jgi:hypothetical protein
VEAQGGVSFPSFGITQGFIFTGTFRLPFSMAKDGSKGHARVDHAAF